MEICVEGRQKSDIRLIYQKLYKLHYEIDSKIDSIDITASSQNIEHLIQYTKSMLDSFNSSLQAFQIEIQAQSSESSEDWLSKFRKMQQYESSMKSRLQKVLQLRSVHLSKNSNGSYGNSKKYDDPTKNGISGLVQEREGLEQSRKIAIEIESYGSLVWNSIKDQSHRLQNIFTRTGQMNDGIGISHTMAGSLNRKSKQDCYLFIGLAILTIVLIIVCYYYVKPMLFK